MTIPEGVWVEYIESLSKVNRVASEKMQKYIDTHEIESKDDIQRMVDYAYGISTKYGEAAAELAAEWYDTLAALSNADVDFAEPAETATYEDAAKAVYGTLKQSAAALLVPGAVGRLVKLAAQNTTLKNARRDHILIAWIPHGETCPYCIMLAGKGWSHATTDHAEHIHANCNCSYAVKFDEDTEYDGYKPDTYSEMYESAEGKTQDQKLNFIRRRFYKENAEKINEQKRSAYAKSKALESSAAEETDIEN